MLEPTVLYVFSFCILQPVPAGPKGPALEPGCGHKLFAPMTKAQCEHERATFSASVARERMTFHCTPSKGDRQNARD